MALAATRVFGRQGYRRTRVAEVATESGMSAGAIYLYVQSKEALFHLVFAHGFDLFAEGLPSLPLPDPAPTETVELIRAGLRRRGGTPLVRDALTIEVVDDVRAELTGIIVERYDVIERLWPLLAVIERSAPDLPELADFYYRRGRRRHVGQLQRYLELRASAGLLRPMLDAAVTARLVTEAITWFAWHRHQDPDAGHFDDERARLAVIDFVCGALIETGR